MRINTVYTQRKTDQLKELGWHSPGCYTSSWKKLCTQFFANLRLSADMVPITQPAITTAEIWRGRSGS